MSRDFTIEHLRSEVIRVESYIDALVKRMTVCLGSAPNSVVSGSELKRLFKMRDDAEMELSFHRATLEIAEGHGFRTAALFKLSDGSIDPRTTGDE